MISEEDKVYIQKLIDEQMERRQMEHAKRNLDGSSKDAVVQSVTDTDGQERLPVQSAQPSQEFLNWLKAWRCNIDGTKKMTSDPDYLDELDMRKECIDIVEAKFKELFGVK